MTEELQAKVDLAIQRLKSFEPEEGYYVAFSGGKDSQCVYHLCKMGGGEVRRTLRRDFC